jgi:hypothetical protein
MKRRSLLVGSALAGVGAILGVAKAGETVSQPAKAMTIPSEMFQVAQPGPMAWDHIYPLYTAGLVSRQTVAEQFGMSGYEMQQLLDPPTFTITSVPAHTFHWFKEGDTLTAAAEYPLPPLDQIITARTMPDSKG